MRRLAGLLGTGSLGDRREGLSQLPADLNENELAAIYSGILNHARPEALPLRAWHALFNNTLNVLVLDQDVAVSKLPDQLAAIIADTSRHRVIRDYALQHLLSFAEYRLEASDRLKVLEQTWGSLSPTRDSYRGTYLAAVAYRAGNPGWPPVGAVAAQAWEVANAEDAHVLSRITALQVCGKLGYTESLPLARSLATDPQAHMTLRTSAIATIGDLGAEDDRALLSALAGRSPSRLHVAIDAAVNRIDERGNQG